MKILSKLDAEYLKNEYSTVEIDNIIYVRRYDRVDDVTQWKYGLNSEISNRELTPIDPNHLEKTYNTLLRKDKLRRLIE